MAPLRINCFETRDGNSKLLRALSVKISKMPSPQKNEETDGKSVEKRIVALKLRSSNPGFQARALVT